MNWDLLNIHIDSYHDLEKGISRLFLILSAFVLLTLEILFYHTFPFLLQAIILVAMLNGIIAFRSDINKVKKHFALQIFLLFSLSSIAKFSLIDQTHSLPLLSFYELGVTAFLIMIFGIKKVYWVPVFTIFTSYSHIILIDYFNWGTHWVYMQNTHFGYFIQVNVFLMIMLVVNMFIVNRLLDSGDKLKKERIALSRSVKLVEESNKEISAQKKAQLDLSMLNSHEMRSHNARIKSVVHMLQNEELSDTMNDAYKREFFYMTVSTSLSQMKDILNEMKSQKINDVQE